MLRISLTIAANPQCNTVVIICPWIFKIEAGCKFELLQDISKQNSLKGER